MNGSARGERAGAVSPAILAALLCLVPLAAWCQQEQAVPRFPWLLLSQISGLVLAISALLWLGWTVSLRRRVATRTRQAQESHLAALNLLEDARLAEEKLRRSEEQYRFLTENSSDVVWSYSLAEKRYLYISPAVEKVYGYTREEALAVSVESHVVPEDLQRVRQEIGRLKREGKQNRTFSIECRQRRKDGALFWTELACTLARDVLGQTDVLIGRTRDISERKQAEQDRLALEGQLRQAQKLESIGTLAGGVAHEINNPINGIMNYAQLIMDRAPADDMLAEFAGEIIHETERVAVIVRNLLAFARQEKLQHSPARSRDIVDATLSLVGAIMRHDQIHLDVHVPDDLPLVDCRSQQIEQVIMNLLTNARDALNMKYPEYHENKRIAITGSRDGSWVRLTVSDRGPGVDEDVRQRMFEPFFTTKPRHKGTGLGLSISHGIIQDHGGRLWVESEPGHGASFHIDLPAMTERVEAQEPQGEVVVGEGFEPSKE